MKKLLLLVTLLTFVLNTNAQKIHFTDSTNQWVVSVLYGAGGFPCALGYNSIYSFVGDTLIGSYTYRKINHVDYPAIGNYACAYRYPDGLYREDTNAGLVFYYDTTRDVDHILYNYNLHYMDTIYDTGMYYSTLYIDTFFVARLDSQLIRGVYHKVFTLGFISYYTPSLTIDTTYGYTYIEGIGELNYPNFPQFVEGFFEDRYNEICFSQDTSYPNFSVNFGNLPLTLSGGIYLDQTLTNIDSCPQLKVPTTYKQQPFTISPNPTTEELHINNVSATVTYRLLNMKGTLNEGDNEVSVLKLYPGIYTLEITTSSATGGGRSVYKVVKE